MLVTCKLEYRGKPWGTIDLELLGDAYTTHADALGQEGQVSLRCGFIPRPPHPPRLPHPPARAARRDFFHSCRA
jgi:hypothetical protein